MRKRFLVTLDAVVGGADTPSPTEEVICHELCYDSGVLAFTNPQGNVIKAYAKGYWLSVTQLEDIRPEV